MVKLIDNKNSNEIKESGYYRMFRTKHENFNIDVVELMTRIPLMIQAGVIRNGDELEHLLSYKKYHSIQKSFIGKIDGKKTVKKLYFNNGNIKYRFKDGWYFNPNISSQLFTKYNMKISKQHLEPDIIIIHNKNIYITELKDGNNFDTKKSEGEGKQLRMIKELFENIVTDLNLDYNVYAELVLWNIDNVNKASIKDKIAKSYSISGKTFSKKHGVDFEGINTIRMKDNIYNIQKMYIWFKEIIKNIDKHKNIINPEHKRALSVSMNNHPIRRIQRSNSERINPKPRILHNLHFTDNQNVKLKEKKIQQKHMEKIKKDNDFIIWWEKYSNEIKNKKTKKYLNNEKKYFKLKENNKNNNE